MNVSIVVPVYNEEKYLRNCLLNIFNQSELPDEVIVVDNNCTDSSMSIAAEFPVKIVRERKQGMIPARNRGFDTAKYEIIARTDADTIVPKNWIKLIKKNFTKHKIAAQSGPARFYRVPAVLQIANWPFVFYLKLLEQICNHECLFGPNMALRKSIWEKVKKEVCLEDKKVHEDIDLSLHIARYGLIKNDYSLVVSSSPRRWKKLKPYFEYSYRYIRTIKRHRESIIAKEGRKLVNTVIPRTKKLLRALATVTLDQP